MKRQALKYNWFLWFRVNNEIYRPLYYLGFLSIVEANVFVEIEVMLQPYQSLNLVYISILFEFVFQIFHFLRGSKLFWGFQAYKSLALLFPK